VLKQKVVDKLRKLIICKFKLYILKIEEKSAVWILKKNLNQTGYPENYLFSYPSNFAQKKGLI
jgi:hypothetical protein